MQNTKNESEINNFVLRLLILEKIFHRVHDKRKNNVTKPILKRHLFQLPNVYLFYTGSLYSRSYSICQYFIHKVLFFKSCFNGQEM